MPDEDFTSWIESDANNRLSRTVSRSTWTGLRRSDSSTWARKDYGIGFFTDFTHEFELVVTGGTGKTSSQTWRSCVYVAAQALAHRASLQTAIALTLEQDTVETPAGKDYSVFIEEFNGGTNYRNEAAGVDFNYGNIYYVRLVRSGVNATVYYYTDAARTVLYGSQSMVLHATPAYRYLMVPDSVSASGTQYTDGYVQNLNLGLIYDGAPQELKAVFGVSHYEELQAEFRVAQDAVDLTAEFRLRQENLDLFAVFKIIKDDQADLFAEFETSTVNATPIDSWGTMYILQQYDISTAKGIGFYWWGAGGWDQLNEFILETPTGFYRGYFADGEAKWNWVFFKIADLEKLAIDGSEPDPTNITGILWTYHSNGLRRVAFLSIWYVEPPDLKGIFTVRHSESLELLAEFTVSHPASEDLKAKFILRQETADLKAEFILRQCNADLFCEFEVGSMRDFQRFTSSGVWTKPAGVLFILIECIAGGGGGGGGRGSISGSRGGGAGAGGAAYTKKLLPAESCPDTVAVTVGAGGTGGASGINGIVGETTSFGDILKAYGGGPGRAGTSGSLDGGGGGGSGSAGSSTGGPGLPGIGASGGISGGGGSAGYKGAEEGGGGGGIGEYYNGNNGGSGGPSIHGGGGGGGAGGLNSGGTEGGGGAGGTTRRYTPTGGGGAGGAVGGGDGGDGDDGADACGEGGGGGGANNAGTGGAGGDGGAPGGGGGGGGGGNPTGGKGGDGARGEVRIWAW